jgi:hypothetical protein
MGVLQRIRDFFGPPRPEDFPSEGLPAHLESFLGPIDGGWRDCDGTKWPFQVVRFSGGPITGARTFVTLGFSFTLLHSPECEGEFRLELMIMARQSFGDRNIPALLHQIGMYAVSSKHGYLRGSVLGPNGRIFEGSEMEAFYVTVPTYLPDEFAEFAHCEHYGGSIAWLIPIYRSEATFVSEQGWNAFEDLLLKFDPDVLDFQRPAIA